MSTQNELLIGVKTALGPAAATMFVEEGRDRHFIAEAALASVVLYVLGKYLDGFMEGLGIPDLGRKHGQAVRDAIGFAKKAIQSELSPTPEELARHGDSLTKAANDLAKHSAEPKALKAGKAAVRSELIEQSLPDSEAERISTKISQAVWQK